jgi:hypothetical protein
MPVYHHLLELTVLLDSKKLKKKKKKKKKALVCYRRHVKTTNAFHRLAHFDQNANN